MFVCVCRGVTVADVRRAGAAGVTAADTLIAALRLDDHRCCGRCRLNIDRFVELATSAASIESASVGDRVTLTVVGAVSSAA